MPSPGILPLNRALAGLAAILIAYSGQRMLFPSGHPFHLGWVLLVLGAALFAVAWWGTDPDGLASFEIGKREYPDARRRAGLALGTVSALFYLYNDWDWARRGESTQTRLMWGLSIALFLAALGSLRVRREQSARRDDDLPRLPAMLLLGLITGIAFSLRFVRLADIPLDVHGDFASIGLGAREILQGHVPELFATSTWYGMPWGAYLQSALSMKVFGDSLFGMNMEAVIAGTATVIGTYCLGSLLLGRSIGLLAAAISAVGYTEIHFSRVSQYIDPVPWLVFGMYFLMRGLRSGKALPFGVSGLLLAIGFEMYFSGRLVAIVLVLLLIYLALFHRHLLLARWNGLIILAFSGILATGPFLLVYWRHFDTFVLRTHQVYALAPGNMRHLLNKYNTDSPFRMMVEQTWRSLLTFNYTGDSSTQFGFDRPLINPTLAPLLVLGLTLAVCRLQLPGYALLSIWLLTGLVVGSVLTIDAPFWPRLVIILPCAAILAAVGLYAAVGTLLALVRRPLRPALVLLAGAVILTFVGQQNWQWYYRGSMSTHVAPIAWIGRLIEKTPPGTGFCMIRGPLSLADRVPQFLGEGHVMVDVPPEQLDRQKQRCLEEGRVWIIIRPDHDALLAALNREWPHARQERYDFPTGQAGPIFWYPPAAATRRRTAP